MQEAPARAGASDHADRLRRGRRVGFLGRIDADLEAKLVLVLELHDAIDQRIDRVVRSEPDVPARVPLRAALPHDDVAGRHTLAAELLDPAELRVAVAAVA